MVLVGNLFATGCLIVVLRAGGFAKEIVAGTTDWAAGTRLKILLGHWTGIQGVVVVELDGRGG